MKPGASRRVYPRKNHRLLLSLVYFLRQAYIGDLTQGATIPGRVFVRDKRTVFG